MNKERVIELAQDAGITFIITEGVTSAPPKWLERFAALIEADVRGDGALTDEGTKQEPLAWLDLLKAAEEIVRGKSAWERFIDGTPLANDIPVWMANFAEEYASSAPAFVAQKPVAWMVTQAQPINDELQRSYKVLAITGDYSRAEAHCDVGNPIPLYTHPAPAASATVTLGSRTVNLQPGDRMTIDADVVAQLVGVLSIAEDYIVEALGKHDEAYCDHPAMQSDRDQIVDDLTQLRAALAAVRGEK